MSLKQLAEVEQVRPPTMVRIVQGLVAEDLATSHPDRDDARRVRIAATTNGRALMLKARKRRVEALARMLDEKSAAERADIAKAVTILRGLRIRHRAE